MDNNMDDDEDFAGRLLHQAALWENQELLEDLLNGDQIAYINSRDTRGRTALHAAAANESHICTRILLQAGADPNMSCSTTHNSWTPLHVAAKHGREENIKLLVEWKADLLAKDHHGLTALDIAEQSGHEECMKTLKQAADQREQFRYEVYHALLEASSRGDIGKMRTLLRELEGEANLVINSAPNGSNTLLFKACEEGHKEIVKLLLDYGADGRIHPVTKYSPLYIACYSGRKDITEILLKRFPKLVQVATVERWLPIHAAAINGHVNILDLLLRFSYPPQLLQTFHDKTGKLEYQLPFDVNSRDVTGQTILYLACYVGNQKLVDLLLKFKVKAVKIDTKEGYSSDGASGACTGMTSSVADRKCDNDAKNDGDTSPKRKLSGGIQMIMSKLSLNKNGDQSLRSNECFINPFDLDLYCSNDTETALHVAVKNKYHSIATMLLANGANPNLKINVSDDDMVHFQDDDCTFTGSTALVEACKNRDYAMIELLLKYGARDDECKALVVAIRAQDEVIISKLLALKTHPDPEYKINKKAFDVIPVTQFGALGFAGVGSVTYSSMFPTAPVMVNWHGQKCLDHIREQWLVDASLSHNPKLKLTSKNQSIALFAITRLDISNNAIAELPESIFQLPSLKYLNAAQNKIDKLPKSCGKLVLQFSPQHRARSDQRTETKGLYDCAALEEIHLQDNRLDSVPSALFELPALVTLDLSNNKLQHLPFKMWTAPKLREMNLSFNLLCDLPTRTKSAMDIRPAARDFADDHSSSESDCSPRHCNTPTDNFLGGSGNHVGVKTYGGVVELSQNGVKYSVGEEAEEGRFPSRSQDSVHSVCPFLTAKQLHHNNLWSHHVDINDSILDDDENSKDSQSQLTSLNLAHNAFEMIPAGLSCLAVNLARLNLSYNRLTEMGPITSYPIGIKQLDLSHNQIHSWPIIRRLDSDLHLDAQGLYCYSSTETSPRHSSKGAFVPLRKLSQNVRNSSSSLASLGSSICAHRRHHRLDNLRTLILADNSFDRLILSIDDDLVGLTSDDDESQESSEISTSSSKDTKCSSPTPSSKSKLLFPNLSMLDICNNSLREIPPNIHEFNNLSVLNISGNTEISYLPPEMGLLNKLWNLNTRGCNLNEPLKTMIDSKKYKTMDVVGYLKSILEDAKPYARMKLMIVGVQGIGKTSLLEQLRQEGTGSYKKKPVEHWAKRMGNKNINLRTAKGVNISTVGVDIGDWTYEKKIRGHSSHGPVIFRTWDFGGQKEYYATHQYFLSKRSLYLCVWKITDGERGVAGIQQWLVNIQARAPNAPVLIVGTHYDLVKEKYPPSFSEDLQQLIRDRFINVVDADKCGLPRVLDTIEVSCKSRHNLKLLCNLIYDTVFELRSPGSKERLLEQRIPATYLALEDVVSYLAVERRLQKKDPVLQSEQYKMLVMHEMQERFRMVFRDMAELNQATAFLHENGVLLHYEDATLKDLYFLDPQWLCDMLAHVVTIREINPFARNGVMKMDDLKHTFKSSQCAPSDAKHYIVNLLNKFEVALTWDNRTLLIPSLLPTEEQMRSGLPGCDVRIPVRSRGWAFRSMAHLTNKPPTNQGSPKKVDESSDPLALSSTPTNSSEHSEADYHIQHHFDPHASILRLLIMSYFPSGFWSRLITRMLADDSIVEIIRSYFVLPREAHQDPSILSILDKRAEWVCWQTGIELRYANTSLFRMKEVLTNLSNAPCEYRQMHFMLQQEGIWGELDMSNSAILEVLLMNQTIVLKRPFHADGIDEATTASGNPNDVLYQSIVLEPNSECVAKLLALAVDHIDTLLEDWYPTLGTRFVHTSEGKFLVTRVVPCTPCLVNQFRGDASGPMMGNVDCDGWNLVDLGGHRGEAACVRQALHLPGPFGRQDGHHTRPGNRSPGGGQSNQGSRDSTTSHDSDSGVGPDSTSSSRKPSAEGRSDLDLAGQDQSLEDNGESESGRHRFVYCFMIEDCILTAYEEKCMRCPSHGGIPLAQLAPDTVFMDLGERYLIRPEAIKRGKMLGRGAFGFVFRASAKQRASNMNIDVAMKMLQPVDPGYGARQSATAAYKAAQSKWQRDPIQYACKAYCTARQELGILLSLRHTNIVPLVGMCTHPLSLVLELAPQGALDSVLKNYRRSGAKLNVFVLQKTIIQIAKALEYLHSQHIIYRDLKSENVLVWQLPPPFHPNPLETVDVKLADYGISRSTLPTGTKGFGGTEGFMAPEIMRYNGEEEYTEKVDCFSFGMFMYELLTLHLPFEGHESVKDYILEGGRPSLSQREIVYPTYILDLMTLCWCQHPKDRPSASQIVSIAAAPEFVHLVDITSLEDNMPVICGAIVSSQEESREIFPFEVPDPTELWLSRKGKQIDILSCTYHGWQDYKTLELDSITISRICVVGDTIWLGDAKGSIHIFSSSQYVQLFCFQLEPDDPVPSAVNNLMFMSTTKTVIVTLTNGHLWLCNAELLSQMGSADEAQVANALMGLGSNELKIHCITTIQSQDSKMWELWCGQSQGKVTIFTLHGTTITSQDVFCHSETITDTLDVLHIVTESTDCTSLWSYVYPGCIVYHWDVISRTVINKLDCSKLAPCSESLKSISIEEHLSPGRCQVTTMTALNGELFIGTTWGCIIIAEGKTMRPITIFRPYEEDVKAILPIVESKRKTVKTENESPRSSPGKTPVRLSSPTKLQTVIHPPVIATIGKGYRNLIGRFTNLPSLATGNDKTQTKRSITALLWKAEHWVGN